MKRPRASVEERGKSRRKFLFRKLTLMYFCTFPSNLVADAVNELPSEPTTTLDSIPADEFLDFKSHEQDFLDLDGLARDFGRKNRNSKTPGHIRKHFGSVNSEFQGNGEHEFLQQIGFDENNKDAVYSTKQALGDELDVEQSTKYDATDLVGGQNDVQQPQSLTRHMQKKNLRGRRLVEGGTEEESGGVTVEKKDRNKPRDRSKNWVTLEDIEWTSNSTLRAIGGSKNFESQVGRPVNLGSDPPLRNNLSGWLKDTESSKDTWGNNESDDESDDIPRIQKWRQKVLADNDNQSDSDCRRVRRLRRHNRKSSKRSKSKKSRRSRGKKSKRSKEARSRTRNKSVQDFDRESNSDEDLSDDEDGRAFVWGGVRREDDESRFRWSGIKFSSPKTEDASALATRAPSGQLKGGDECLDDD